MASASKQIYDVVIANSALDAGLAFEVANICAANGLNAFQDRDIPPGADFGDELWEALAESRALLLILSPAEPTSSMLIEIGAARAWNKPIFAVVTDPAQTRLAPAFSDIRLFTQGGVEEVVRAIKQGGEQLSADDRSILARLYADAGVPVDQLLLTPGHLQKLWKRFKKETGKDVPGERLLSELLRMRKQGLLKGSSAGRTKPQGSATP
jgi:hypothetical protein